jgi:uncharacterized membrane protein
VAELSAKDPLSQVAGPYGHPFHPILVTIPIGAWVSSLVFDIATRLDVSNSRALIYGSEWLIGIGIVGAVLAAIFGLLDFLTIPRGTPAFRTGLTHLALNAAILVLFVVSFLWRYGDWEELAKVRAAQIMLSVAALLMLGVSGWLGGKLTYRYGVRVAREADQADGFISTTVPHASNGETSLESE